MCISCIAFACGVAVQGYLFLSSKLPSIEQIEKLKNYEPGTVTEMFADDGELIAEFSYERRYVVPIEDIPQALQDAVVAVEGHDFLLKPIRHYLCPMGPKQRNEFVQRARRALLLYRVRRVLTEKEIMWLYLNQIYLGDGSYGVEAAARAYFGKHAKDLSLSECAMIAGLIKKPRAFSPRDDVSKALKRRNYVLLRMLEEKKTSQAEYEKARCEELVIAEKTNPYKEEAASLVEQV